MSDVPKDTVVEKGFKIGISTDKNNFYRKTMEDAHTYVCNYNDVPGQGFFAIFDGHVNKLAAEYCGDRLHKDNSTHAQFYTGFSHFIHGRYYVRIFKRGRRQRCVERF